MEPLFNLYGNPGEGEATQTQITDEDIQNAKKADQLSSVASIALRVERQSSRLFLLLYLV